MTCSACRKVRVPTEHRWLIMGGVPGGSWRCSPTCQTVPEQLRELRLDLEQIEGRIGEVKRRFEI